MSTQVCLGWLRLGLWLGSCGLPRASAAPAPRWHTPVSTYPPAALARRIGGQGVVHVTTDQLGWVTDARMERSTGSSILDEATVRTAKSAWQGPRNTTANLPIEYKLPPRHEVASAPVNHPGWTLPKHSYPFAAGDDYEQGRGVVRATTGPNGRVQTAVMTGSTGHTRLDTDAVNNARQNWRGPPSTTADIPVVYRLDTDVPLIPPPGPGMKWHTPIPHYPYKARAGLNSGSGYIRISTDERGKVVRAVMTESTGDADLDENTANYALARWSGPPNKTCRVPITYLLRR